METELTTATQIIISGGVEIFSKICLAWIAVELIKVFAIVLSGGKK